MINARGRLRPTSSNSPQPPLICNHVLASGDLLDGTVKKLIIVDTDAGLLNQNVFEQKGYLNRISHMHPDTFARLVDFAQRWKTDPSVKGFFHEECTFSNSQLARFEKYLLNAATVLQSRKDRGQLRLDLSLDDFFGAQPPPPNS